MESLRNKAIKSLSWSLAAKLISQGVTLVATVLLARILVAEDFGLAALSLVYIGLVQQFIDAGFLHAIIQREKINQRELSSCFWFLLGFGSLVFFLSYFASDFFDGLFNAKGIGSIIVVYSSIFFFLPFRTIAQSLLSRELRIDSISKREAITNLLRFGLSLLMAWKGAGVWSLVIPMVIGEIVYSLSCYRIAAWNLTFEFSWKAIKPIIYFGTNISLSRIVWFSSNRVDQFIIGRVLGIEMLGIYSIAMQFANAIPQFVSGTLSRVVFPVFSKLQNNINRLKEIYLGVTRYTILICFPAFIGLGLIAPDLFLVVFKPAWYAAILPLQILCLLSLLRLCESFSGFLLNARNKPHVNLVINIFSLLLTSLGVYIGSYYWGINGVACAATASFIPVVLLSAGMAIREVEGNISEYLDTFKLPLMATVAMTIGVIAIGKYIPIEFNISRITVMAFSGILFYVIIIFFFSPRILSEIKNDLHNY